MHILGITLGCITLLLDGLLLVRGALNRVFRVFPLFYSYVVYCVGSSIVLYAMYWLEPVAYSRAYWFAYLVNDLTEFAVLVEISDHIFRPFAVIRNLGRALTILITAFLGLVYILPAVLWSSRRSVALLDFTLRTSLTKAVILVVLFYVAQHYGSRLGKNVGGLMLGLATYVAAKIAIMASALAFGSGIFARFFWFMLPLASLLCVLVWTVSLWEVAPGGSVDAVPATAAGGEPDDVTLELTRFNNELTKIVNR